MRTALALGLAAQRSLTCNEAVVLDPGQSGDGE
jgi:hypothetical protein